MEKKFCPSLADAEELLYQEALEPRNKDYKETINLWIFTCEARH